ncbi:type II toxin-antitoxin system HicA family toxin [Candidatus Micrarchaeota archaeon]|nr:type II toxin-antitoxin system HicA family toxin [Candidatus Micrarchaeota archaeon]
MKLPVLSGTEVVKTFERIGFRIDHHTGSHIILRKETAPFTRLTVPKHREVAKGTLRAIIRQAGLTHEEFLELI